MVNETRREFLALSGLASAALLGPVRALAQAVKPVRIRDVELFRLDIPVSKAELEISEKNRLRGESCVPVNVRRGKGRDRCGYQRLFFCRGLST